MRVLLVALGVYDREGGIERVNRRILRGLAELARPGEAPVALSLRDHVARPAELPSGAVLEPGAASRPRTIAAFVRLLVTRRPFVILYTHVLLVPLALIAWILLPRTRQVLLVHGIEVWDPPGGATRWIVRHAVDDVVAVSRYTAGRMADGYGIDPASILAMPLAIDGLDATSPGVSPDAPAAAAGDRRAAHPGGSEGLLSGGVDGASGGTDATMAAGARSGHGHDGAGPHILTVSRLTKGDAYKNVDKVIYALQALVPEFPDLRYVVLGDGDWLPDLQALARDAGLERHVAFRGRVSDEERDGLYDESDLFVLPSTKEGFGLVFLEAWQHMLPVIGATEGASAEVIEHGVNGLCIEPTPPAIAAAIGSLLRDPERRRRMGEAGRRTVEDRYTHRQFRERLGTILEEQLRVRNSRNRRAAGSPRP